MWYQENSWTNKDSQHQTEATVKKKWAEKFEANIISKTRKKSSNQELSSNSNSKGAKYVIKTYFIKSNLIKAGFNLIKAEFNLIKASYSKSLNKISSCQNLCIAMVSKS